MRLRPDSCCWTGTMLELVDRQALETPDSAAVVFGNRHSTYSRLILDANSLAAYLSGLGIGPEDRVGIAMERCAEMVIALLAVMKAGAAYLPLDPALPAQRLKFMLDDAGVRVLVTQADLAQDLSGDNLRIIRLDHRWFTLQQAQSMNAQGTRTGLSPDNLAYVIYTSGSTGEPKG